MVHDFKCCLLCLTGNAASEVADPGVGAAPPPPLPVLLLVLLLPTPRPTLPPAAPSAAEPDTSQTRSQNYEKYL